MLGRKKCRWYDKSRLIPRLKCRINGVHRHLCFSKTNITTEESIHDMTTTHLTYDLINTSTLILRIIKPREFSKFLELFFLNGNFRRFYESSCRCSINNLPCYLQKAFFYLLFKFTKTPFTKSIKYRSGASTSDISVYIV